MRNEETKYQYGLINDEYLGSVINLLKERITFLKDVFTFGDYMFQKPQVFEKDYAEKFWNPSTKELINPLLDNYNSILESNWNHDSIQLATKNFVAEKSLSMKNIINPLRLMLTGKSVGASMFDTMAILGKTECIERLNLFVENN